MNFKYEVITNLASTIIKRTDEEGNEAWIPTDEANSDYQNYLAQLDNQSSEHPSESG
jgi:hypothetical protein